MKMLYQPRRIELELSSYCNAKCISCTRIQIDGDTGLLYKNPYTVLNKNLDFDFLEEKVFSQPWFKHVRQFGSVGNNGDPMMNPEIAKIFERAREVNNSVGLFVHTNGSIGNKATWKRLAKVFNSDRDKFSFSIDGSYGLLGRWVGLSVNVSNVPPLEIRLASIQKQKLKPTAIDK